MPENKNENNQILQSPFLNDELDNMLIELERENIIGRLWGKDPSIWKSDPDSQKLISNSLGWLNVVDRMYPSIRELKGLADKIKSEGYKTILHMGMGGSSLAPEVMGELLGRSEIYSRGNDYPTIKILDTTDPDAIRSLEKSIDIEKTIFIVASKSGSTTETDCFYRYFYHRISEIKGENAGAQFIAITDPASALEKTARDKNFRRCFINFEDIGGRYSALSYFGLVPAALIGIDVEKVLDNAKEMVDTGRIVKPIAENEAAVLGVTIGLYAANGKDKLTVVFPQRMEPFGDWLEQLIAESTGKEGKAIIPIIGEEISAYDSYGSDRLFIFYADKNDADRKEWVEKLGSAGYPIIKINTPLPESLPQEFFRWEIATAVAGWVLKINPFDQPNVQESKDIAKKFIADYVDKGNIDFGKLELSEGNISLFGEIEGSDIKTAIQHFIKRAQKKDYIALMAFINPSAENRDMLFEIRKIIRNKFHIATTLGFGPRFLHSTGQMHKGGPDNGLYIQITESHSAELPIPGLPYSFGDLIDMQALGDFHALIAHKRKIIRVHLSDGLGDFKKLFEDMEGI